MIFPTQTKLFHLLFCLYSYDTLMLKCMYDAHTYKANDCAVLGCSVVSESFRPHGLLCPARLLCPWEFSRQEYWSGLHALFLGIFTTQGLNPSLLHCSRILYQLSYQGSPGQWLTLINFQSSLALNQLFPSGSSTFNHMVKNWSARLCKNSREVWLGLLTGFFTS